MSPLAILERHFQPMPVPASIPHVSPRSGVYMLVDLDEIAYVGSSANVEFRVYVHAVEQRTTGLKSFDRAIWIPLPPAVHPDCEGAFIRALRPRDNYKCPRHRGHDAEILDGFGITNLLTEGPFSRNRDRSAPSPLAVRIRAARLKARMSTVELAESLSLCRQTIHHWEAERNVPSREHISDLASVLGCRVADLIQESN